MVLPNPTEITKRHEKNKNNHSPLPWGDNDKTTGRRLGVVKFLRAAGSMGAMLNGRNFLGKLSGFPRGDSRESQTLSIGVCPQMSSVIYFRHNDMQDCVIKLGKWYRTAVAEARGRLFVLFFCASSRKQMLCNRFLHIIHSLDISFSYLKILAIRSWPSRKYRNCMLKETSISL